METHQTIQYVVHSRIPTSVNKNRCWMNIGVAKLQKAATEGKPYHFQFNIGEENHLFSASAKELQEKFDEYGVSVISSGENRKYSFYVDYRSGEIFATVSEDNRDIVFTLHEEAGNVPGVIGDDVDDTQESDTPKN